MHNLNTLLFQFVHQGSGQFLFLDEFFVWLTGSIAYTVVAGVLLYMIVLYPFRTKNITERVRRYKQGIEVLLSVGTTAIVVWIIKVIVAYPRPFIVLADVTPLVSATPFESFPSAHAALTMALAVTVVPFHRHVGHLLIAFALLVGLSRLYVGVHYPFDVIVGYIIGYGIAQMIHRVFRQRQDFVSQ